MNPGLEQFEELDRDEMVPPAGTSLDRQELAEHYRSRVIAQGAGLKIIEPGLKLDKIRQGV